MKLVQTEWHPGEIFKCPKTNVEYKLYNIIPRKKEEVLEGLYKAYFKGFRGQFQQLYMAEPRKLKELHPELSDSEVTYRLFLLEPLSAIPSSDQKEIIAKHPNPISAFQFVERNFLSYKRYLKKKDDES